MQYLILRFFQQISTGFLASCANFFSMLAEEGLLIFFMLLIYYVWDKRKGFSIFSSLLCSQLMTNCIKAVVRMPRPFTLYPELESDRIATATGYSFPSGHSTGAAAFYTAAAKEKGGRLWLALSVILAVLVGLSRLMLRVHWPLDVFTGLVIGFVFALAFTTVTDRIYDQKEKRICWCRCFSLISGLAGTVLMILLSFRLADPTAFSDLMKVLALASGSYAGCLIETLYVSFTVQREWRKSILTVVLAMLGAALIMAAKLIVPSPLYYLGALVRYALIGLWATGLWPLIAVRLGLMESDA